VAWTVFVLFFTDWVFPESSGLAGELSILMLLPWGVAMVRRMLSRPKDQRAFVPRVVEVPRWGRWMPKGVWPAMLVAVFYSPMLLAAVTPLEARGEWYGEVKPLAISMTVLLAVVGALLMEVREGSPGRGIALPDVEEQRFRLRPVGCMMWILPASALLIAESFPMDPPWNRWILYVAMGVAGVHFCLGVVEARRWGRVILEAAR
jgi:hypothetical protein